MNLIDTKANILDIKITFQCNNLCWFCVAGDKRKLFPDATAATIRSALKKNSGCRDTVVFTGGEPTVRKDLPELARFAREDCGYKNIVIQTNGRMFAYMDYAAPLVKAGANQFMVSIHGHRAALHDHLTTQRDSFAETALGIKNLKALGQTVATNTVITKPNYRNLPEISRMLCALGIEQMQFAFLHIEGKAKVNAAGIVPPMTLVIPYLFHALDIAAGNKRVALTEGIPLCMLKGREEFASEALHRNVRVVDEGGDIDEFQGHRRTNLKAKGPECRGCRRFDACEGPWADYPEMFGWKEFKPPR